MPTADPDLAALPLWPDTVDAFYADRTCAIRAESTRKTWGHRRISGEKSLRGEARGARLQHVYDATVWLPCSAR